MADPVRSPSIASASLVASIRVPAAALESALGPLVLRARLQRMAAAADGQGVGDPVIRALVDPEHGVTLASDDGIVRTALRDAVAVPHEPLSIILDARELQRAISEIVIGVDAGTSPLTLAITPGATIVEMTRDRPAGRTTVMRALLQAALTDDVTLPVLAAFATRAAIFAVNEPAALLADPALDCALDAVRQTLLNREYEVWTSELPAWIVAASEVLDECDVEARARLAMVAEAALAPTSDGTLTESDRELAYALVLVAACHDGRDRIPGPVRGAVPMALLAALAGDAAALDRATAALIPSQRERFDRLVDHTGLRAVAPAPSVAAAVLGRDYDGESTVIDADTRRYLGLVARGEVREVDASFALRLTAVPVHVLRGALVAHGRLGDAEIDALSADERAMASAVAEAWPGTTLPDETLDWIASAADRAATRLESVMQQAAKQKRQDAQRRTRQLTVRQLVPADIGADATRRIRVPSAIGGVEAAATRVGDSGSSRGAPMRSLLLPPAPLAFAAADARAPILCDLANEAAVVMMPPGAVDGAGEQYALLATWCANVAATTPGAIVRRALTASSEDLVVLWGDEVIAARAAAAASDPDRIANPADGVAVSLSRSEGRTTLETGASTLTVGAERTGMIVALRERMERAVNAVERTLTFDARRVPITEDATITAGAQAAAAAARQGVGRPLDGEGAITDVAPRVDLLASAGTGYLALHDGVREHVITPAAIEIGARPTRVTIPPTLLSDALDLARHSTTSQEAARSEFRGAWSPGATRLRIQPYGEAIGIDRGRVTVSALRVDDVLDGDVTLTHAPEASDERDASAAIAIVAARAVL